MNSTHKKLTLLTLLSVVSCGAVVFASIANLSSVPFTSIKASGSTSYSVSFSRSDAYSDSGTTYTYKKNSSVGNEIYLVSTDGMSRNSGALATVPQKTETSKASPVLKFYKYSDASKAFMHQSLSSITVTTSRTITLSILTSYDGVTYRERGTLSCGTSSATFSAFGEYDYFVGITVNTDGRANFATNITGVSLAYECESLPYPSFVSGVTYSAVVKDKSNRDSPISIHINDDGYGYYTFFYNTNSTTYYTLFTWVFDEELNSVDVSYLNQGPAGSSVEGMSSTGSVTNYQEYCLFDRFSMSDIRHNYFAVIGNSIYVYFNTNAGSTIQPRTSQRETVTILNKAS